MHIDSEWTSCYVYFTNSKCYLHVGGLVVISEVFARSKTTDN